MPNADQYRSNFSIPKIEQLKMIEKSLSSLIGIDIYWSTLGLIVQIWSVQCWSKVSHILRATLGRLEEKSHLNVQSFWPALYWSTLGIDRWSPVIRKPRAFENFSFSLWKINSETREKIFFSEKSFFFGIFFSVSVFTFFFTKKKKI